MTIQTTEVQAPWARQTVVRARLSPAGLEVWFADGLRAKMSLPEVCDATGAVPLNVSLSDDQEVVVLHLPKGRKYPITWGSLRYRADAGFRAEMHSEVVRTNLHVGARIRLARETAGATQTALAQLAGVSRATLSRIELGQQDATIPTMLAIAKALDLSVGALLVGEGED